MQERGTLPAMNDDATADTEDPAGTRIGPYRVLAALGAGGMGSVYLAVRDDAEYEQRVAIKVMRGGPLSREFQARFRTERQILARLQHPNIARLQDGGTTSDGTPYLVMEFVDGEPIDAYCDRLELGLVARLRLFRTVCAAVHAAHQHLIVHRDLKPTNILVNQDGVPKLLDFGIAKLLDPAESGLHTVAFTQADLRIMTPDHASPEQIRGETITTASDVYVLGVLLYELLTGQRPFLLTSRRIADIEKAICEKDAELPSQCFADAQKEAVHKAAAMRGANPGRLRRAMAGDLDNIVLMAMRKEPQRRYASAQQLASDIGRYLDGRPVIARRDTLGYRMRKFLQRNWAAAGAFAALFALLCAFAATSHLQAKRIAKERDLVAAQRASAERERQRATEVSDFLVNLFRLADPERSTGNQVTARELLDSGAARLRGSLDRQPEAKAALLNTVGAVYNSLGLYGDALPVLDESLRLQASSGIAAANIKLDTLLERGRALTEAGELAAAEQPLAAGLRLAQASFGGASIETGRALALLGRLRQTQGRFDVAEQLYRRGLHNLGASGAPMTDLTWLLNDLAQVLERRDEWQQAKEIYQRAIEIDSRWLGKDHPRLAFHMLNLAQSESYLGDLRTAEPLYAEAIRRFEAAYGPAHPDTFKAWGSYGRFLQRIGRLDDAGSYLQKALRGSETLYGLRHMQVGYQHVNLGLYFEARHNYAAAASELQRALDIYGTSLPSTHPWRGALLMYFARLQVERNRPAQGLKFAEEAVSIWEQQAPQSTTQLGFARAVRAYALLANGRAVQARDELRAVYPNLLRARGPSDPLVQKAQVWLNAAVAAAEKP
jgi:eukaryotic-like serine/threonine-protein kinase